MWGSIFTEEQIWDLIAYLYSFQFEYPCHDHKFNEQMSKQKGVTHEQEQKQKAKNSFPWPLVALGGVLLLSPRSSSLAEDGDGGGTPSIAVDQQKIDYGYVKFGESRNPSRSKSPTLAMGHCASRKIPTSKSWRGADRLN